MKLILILLLIFLKNSSGGNSDPKTEIPANYSKLVDILKILYFRDETIQEDLKSLKKMSDGTVSFKEIKKFLEHRNVSNSYNTTKFLVDEANARALIGLPGVPKRVIEFYSNKTTIDELALEQIFLHPQVRDRQIVLLSIVGEFRKGKSFLLDYFLRYLYYNYASLNTFNKRPKNLNKNPTEWMGDPDAPLQGFSWKFGSERNTTGIVFWNDVFFHDAKNGEKYAILLVDTQGLYDFETPSAINTKVFALTALMSSVLIFNMKDCNEEHLRQLRFATEFSLFFMENNGKSFKMFQNLLFLARDWDREDEYAYGYEGGDTFLKEKVLKLRDNQVDEMKEMRKYIDKSYERIRGYLMPHPGKKVTKKNYNGNWGDMDNEFVNNLLNLTTSLLAPENLTLKKIGGVTITAEIFYTHLLLYTRQFDNSTVPNIQSLYKTTVDIFMKDLVTKHFEMYEKKMQSIRFENTTLDLIYELHRKYRNDTLKSYDSSTKMGNGKNIEFYRKELDEKMEKLYANKVKILTQIIENNKKIREQEFKKFQDENQERLNQLNEQLKKTNKMYTDITESLDNTKEESKRKIQELMQEIRRIEKQKEELAQEAERRIQKVLNDEKCKREAKEKFENCKSDQTSHTWKSVFTLGIYAAVRSRPQCELGKCEHLMNQ